MSDSAPEEEFFTPANAETVNFRLSLLKNYPNYIKTRSHLPSGISTEYEHYALQRVSSFTTDGNIAKIIEYKDGKHLLSTHRGVVAEFHVATDSYKELYRHHNTRVSALEYDHKTDTVISGGQDGTLLVNKSHELVLHSDRIVDIERLNHSTHVITISHDETWSLVDYNSCQKLYQQEGYSSPLTSLSVSPYDNLLVTSDSSEIQLHDLRSGNLVARKQKSREDPCHSMRLLADNRHLLVSGRGNLKLFDLRLFDKDTALSETIIHSGNLITSMDVRGSTIVTSGFSDASIEFTALNEGNLVSINSQKSLTNKLLVSDDKLLSCRFDSDGSVLTGGFSAKVGVVGMQKA